MAIDEEHDDGFGGRSKRRRAINESWRWSKEIVLLPEWHVAAIPMPDLMRAAILVARTLTAPGARKRQFNHIDSWIRDLDEDDRAALRALMDHPPAGADPDSVVARWTARLLEGGEEAIDALIAEYPSTDRQRVRTIARSGKKPAVEKLLRELVARD